MVKSLPSAPAPDRPTRAPLQAPAGPSLPQQIYRTLVLALPVMAARAGLIIMITVDTIMVGRAGAQPLAHYGIGFAPHIVLMVLGIGLLSGTVILTAQSDGAGRSYLCGAIWRRGLAIAGTVGVIFGLLLLNGPLILTAMGQTPEMATAGGEVLRAFALGMPAILMYIASTMFLEGIGRPRAGMTVALSANLLNVALNWVLIDGNLGFEAQGASGAALGTTLTRWAMFLAIAGYVLACVDRSRYGVLRPVEAGAGLVRRMLRLGAPLAMATGFEVSCFAVIATFAGRMGEVPMAAYQICINVLAFAFMMALGLSTATAVRVGNAVGREDQWGLRQAGWLGAGLCAALMLLLGLLIAWQRLPLAQLYTQDPAVLAIAVPGLLLIAAVLLTDGLQAVLIGALRGTADVLVPSLIQGFSFWVLAVPLAYFLGLVNGWGVRGLLLGICLGLLSATILLSVRFHIVSKRVIRPY